MASKRKLRSRSTAIPVAKAMPLPVATAVPVRMASASVNRVLNRIKKGSTWMTTNNWLWISKLITIVGLVIFIVATVVDKDPNGEIAAYSIMTIGVAATLIMTTIMLARTSKGEGTFSFIIKMAGLYLPTLATLGVLIVMIYIFSTVKNILVKDSAHLPSEFYTFHYLTFFFLFLQIILLYQFFGGEINSTISKGKIPDPYRNAYIAGFILFSIISLGSAAELFVIITRFITDG